MRGRLRHRPATSATLPPLSGLPRIPRSPDAADPVEGPAASAPAAHAATDVRAKRPPALLFLLHADTGRRIGRVLVLLALDAGAIWLAVFTALSVKATALGAPNAALAADQTKQLMPFTLLVVGLLFARQGMYGRRPERPGLAKIVAALFQATVVALVFALVDGQRFSSYYIFYGTLGFGIAYVTLLRFAYESATARILRATGHERRALLIGPARHADAIADALAEDQESAITVIGVLALDHRPQRAGRPPTVGGIGDLVRVLDAVDRPDEVIITDPAFPEELALEVVDLAHQRGVFVRVAPSTMEILVHRAELVPGQTVPLFELKPPVSEGFSFLVKRSFDITVSSALLLVLSPFLIAMAVGVKATSRGPVLYRSRRPGVGSQPFDCLKFRSMHVDADDRQPALEGLNEVDGGVIFKIRSDPRVTAIGRLLRAFSLDELPQLWNVLRGEMSLVGPRPLPQRDYDRMDDWHKKRYRVLPGLTGLWQVSGRSDLDFDEMVRLDFLYLERWSVALDLSILLKTVPAVLLRRGAF